MPPDRAFELHSCRQLFELYPASTSLRPAIDVIERTIRDEPGIAFAHCRGLLETVCITILRDRGIDIQPNPSPRWLMSQAVQSLELTAQDPDDKDAERGVSDVLKGLNLLVEGVVALRNSQGIGPHGKDVLEKLLSADYAVVTATAVDTAIGLMFRLHQSQLGRDPTNHLRFGVHADFDAHLDDKYSDLQIEEAPISAARALYHQDRLAYRKSLVEFRGRGDAGDDEFAEGESTQENPDG